MGQNGQTYKFSSTMKLLTCCIVSDVVECCNEMGRVPLSSGGMQLFTAYTRSLVGFMATSPHHGMFSAAVSSLDPAAVSSLAIKWIQLNQRTKNGIAHSIFWLARVYGYRLEIGKANAQNHIWGKPEQRKNLFDIHSRMGQIWILQNEWVHPKNCHTL